MRSSVRRAVLLSEGSLLDADRRRPVSYRFARNDAPRSPFTTCRDRGSPGTAGVRDCMVRLIGGHTIKTVTSGMLPLISDPELAGSSDCDLGSTVKSLHRTNQAKPSNMSLRDVVNDIPNLLVRH